MRSDSARPSRNNEWLVVIAFTVLLDGSRKFRGFVYFCSLFIPTTLVISYFPILSTRSRTVRMCVCTKPFTGLNFCSSFLTSAISFTVRAYLMPCLFGCIVYCFPLPSSLDVFTAELYVLKHSLVKEKMLIFLQTAGNFLCSYFVSRYLTTTETVVISSYVLKPLETEILLYF